MFTLMTEISLKNKKKVSLQIPNIQNNPSNFSTGWSTLLHYKCSNLKYLKKLEIAFVWGMSCVRDLKQNGIYRIIQKCPEFESPGNGQPTQDPYQLAGWCLRESCLAHEGLS